MFSNEDQEAILRFIFSGEANVELALGVLAARHRISERIIKDFLTRLETELGLKARQLGDSWKVVNELQTNPFERYLQVYMTKQDWSDLYRISLGPENWRSEQLVHAGPAAGRWTDQGGSARAGPKWHNLGLVALLDVGRPLYKLD